jgi:hypothetical protein
VLLGRNRARPRCTVRGAGAAHGHAAHDLNRRSVRGPRAVLAAQLGRPTQRMGHDASARRHCPAARGSAAALLGEPAAARHRRTGDGDSPARRRRRGTTATGERRETASDRASVASDHGGRDDGASEASGRGVGGACEAAVGRGAGEARQLSGRTARYLDSGFKPRRRLSARCLTSGARCQ